MPETPVGRPFFALFAEKVQAPARRRAVDNPPAEAEHRRSMIRTDAIDLCGPWRFEPVGVGPAGRIVVPSHWSHGEAWGYPGAWHDAQQAWYRRRVAVPARWSGRRIRLRFGAVLLRAEVFVDGRPLGEHTGGFTPFAFDLGDVAGRALELAVRVSSVEAVMPAPDVYTYPVSYNEDREEGPIARGIWQPVALTADPPVHVESWVVRTSLAGGAASVELVVRNDGGEPFEGRARIDATDGAALFPPAPVAVAPGAAASVVLRRPLRGLPLWSHRSPVLVDALARVTDRSGAAVHERPLRLGFREVSIRGDRFRLNGETVHLLGFSLLRHRVSPHIWRRDYLRRYFAEMRRLGFNAMRVHGCIGPEPVLDAADEAGLLVEAQSSIWSNPEPRYWAGGETFVRNALAEQRDWIGRDRNHPSIAMWDVDNEMARINPRSRRLSAALIAAARGQDPTRPCVASGAGRLAEADLDHLHCIRRLDRVIDAWAADGRRRPLIAGEWWPDETEYGLHMIQRPPGLSGTHRYPLDFSRPRDIDAALGGLFGRTIRRHRLRGLAGTFPFGSEVYLFEPPFEGRARLDVRATPDDPVRFTFAEDHRHAEWVSVRRPHVNPGWDPRRPAVRRNAAFSAPVRAALRPVIAGFREEHAAVRPGVERRTLVVVNDGATALDARFDVTVAGRVAGGARIRARPGGIVERSVRLRVPPALAGREVAVRARWMENGRLRSDGLAHWRVYGDEPPRPAAPRPVFVTGAGPAVADALRRAGGALVETAGAPDGAEAWVVGRAPDLDRDAVTGFLRRGGRLLVLRQESMPPWLPALAAFECAVRINGHDARTLGFPAAGRELGGIRDAPTLAPAHPLFAGRPRRRRIGPWRAGDGRVADDHFLKKPGAAGGGAPVALVGGATSDSMTVWEAAFGAGRLIVCQLFLEENAAAGDPEAEHVLRRLAARLVEPAVARAAACSDPALARRLRAETGIDVAPWRPGRRIASDVGLVILTGAAARRAASGAGRADPALDAYLRAGGQVLCLARRPADAPASWRPARRLACGWICSLVRRPAPLSGWTSTDLDGWSGGPPARFAWAPARGRGPWRDAVLAFEHHRVSRKAGASVERLHGSLWKTRRVGRGAIHVTALDLARADEPGARRRRESLLANAGVPLAPDAGVSFVDIPRVEVRRTAPLPLDGDYWKWAAPPGDANLSRWSRAEPLILRPRGDRPVPAGADLARHAAVAYLLWDEERLYAAAISVAPEHVFSDSHYVYRHSHLSLFVATTQICMARDTAGRPAYYVHGVPLRGGGLADARSRVTERAGVPDWPDLASLPLGDRGRLRTCFFELALPWRVLETEGPRAGGEVRVAIGVGHPGAPSASAGLELVAPPGYRFQEPDTCLRARLAE